MRSIGGYFELERMSGTPYYKNAIELNSGRNCLRYLIRANKIRKIYIPLYLCEAITKVCQEEKCDINYYSLNDKLLPLNLPTTENISDGWIYLVNYFGMTQNEIIGENKKIYYNLIVDNSQAFFQESCNGVAIFYTCRKFFGVPDGAYLYNAENYIHLDTDVSNLRMAHILGRLEENPEKYFNTYQYNEQIFNHLKLKEMSALTKNLLCGIDYKAIKNKRTENFVYLAENLSYMNELYIPDIMGAYAP